MRRFFSYEVQQKANVLPLLKKSDPHSGIELISAGVLAVERDFAEPGTALALIVRGKALPARVASLPFVPHRYQR